MTPDYEFLALQEAERYRKAILNEFSRGLRGDILEVGCGVGQVSKALLSWPTVTSLTCLEPDGRFLEEHQKNAPGAVFLQGIARDYVGRFNPHAIVSVNVLEHIDDDGAELRFYRRMLSLNEGTLCLLVPACHELYAAMDAKFGHFRRYNKAELREKLFKANFKDVDIHYFNSAGYFAWLLIYRLLGKTSFEPGTVRFYDRRIFPWVYWLETHVCRPPLGQSLVALAR